MESLQIPQGNKVLQTIRPHRHQKGNKVLQTMIIKLTIKWNRPIPKKAELAQFNNMNR